MGEVTMEKLLTDFRGVVNNFNELVNNGDIKNVKKALQEIEGIIATGTDIQLDNPDHPQSDHVLHELLKNIGGVIKLAPNLSAGQRKELEEKLKELEKKRDEKQKLYDFWKKCSRIKASKIAEIVKQKEEELSKLDKNSPEYERVSKELEILKIQQKILGAKTRIAMVETEIEGDTDNFENKDLEQEKTWAYVELEAAQRKRQEIGKQLRKDLRDINAEIAKIKEQLGLDPDRQAGEFDVTAEVKRIGDKIFKTAAIREELRNRDISREEFVAFYESGIEHARKNLEKLKAEEVKMVTEVQEIFNDPDSEKQLFEQANDAREANDEETLKKIYEKIRLKMLEKGYTQDILNTEITNAEQVAQFENFLQEYINQFNVQVDRIRGEIREQKENAGIFRDEIDTIREEQRSLEIAEAGVEGLREKKEAENQLRNEQIRASLLGASPEMKKEWNERFARFYSHKKIVTGIYINAENQEQEIEYETIEDYPEMEEDAYFLNLEDYKKYLEVTTKYKNSNGDERVLGPEIQELMQMAEERQPGGGKKLLDATMEDMEKYVATFHGHTNKYKIKYDTYKTGGSTLKSMIPVKNLTPAKKAAAVTSNIFRYFGLRMPKFTRIDENGQEVKDIKGGLLTLGTDALVVGGAVAAGVIGGPWGLAALGTAYAAKGVVTLGNLAAAGITKRRHKYEIENNIPTTMEEEPDKKEQEVARRDYYRTVEEKGRFSSWVKAKSDRYFRRKRGNETLEKIVAKRQAESQKANDEKYDGVIETAQANVEKAQRNQQRRSDNYRKTVLGENAYNDIVRDPDAVDLDEAESIIAQNAALGSRGRTGRDVNPNSQVAATHQYVKDEEPLEITEKLQEVKEKGGTIASTAITEEQRYRARKEKQDNRNRVATIILSMVGKMGIDYLRTGFKVQTTEEIPAKYEKREIMADQDKMPDKLSELDLKEAGANDVYEYQSSTSNAGDIINSGQPENLNDAAAAAVQYIDKSGNEVVASIAQKGLGYTTKHVHSLINGNISDMSPTELVEAFQQADPTNFGRIIQDMGLQGKTAEEIAKALIKGGNLHLQGKSMQGWQNVLADSIKTVKVGTGQYEDVLVQVAQTIPKVVFSPGKIAEAAAVGAAAGTGIAVTEALHEAAHRTNRVSPGTFEQTTPNLRNYFAQVVREGQEALNRAKREQEQEQQQAETER